MFMYNAYISNVLQYGKIKLIYPFYVNSCDIGSREYFNNKPYYSATCSVYSQKLDLKCDYIKDIKGEFIDAQNWVNKYTNNTIDIRVYDNECWNDSVNDCACWKSCVINVNIV